MELDFVKPTHQVTALTGGNDNAYELDAMANNISAGMSSPDVYQSEDYRQAMDMAAPEASIESNVEMNPYDEPGMS